MRNKAKPVQNLKLQTYKVDNQVLISKINQLNQLKSELQTTLSKHRNQESSIIDQLEDLKIENQKLRTLVSDLQFAKKSQINHIQQLETKLELAEANSTAYQKRLEKEEHEKEVLRNFYEQKITVLSEKKQFDQDVTKEGRLQVSNVIQYKNPPQSLENSSISSIAVSSKSESNKKIKRLKKPSLQMEFQMRPSTEISQKYHTGNIIDQRQDDSHLSGEDVYLQMIRKLYKQLLKIQIHGRELLKIPQIQAFNQLRNPSKNDLAKLCSSYPFHIRQNNKVDCIYEFVLKEAQRRGKLLNGRFIIELIIQQIEQIQSLQDIQLNDGSLSSYFTDHGANLGRGNGWKEQNIQLKETAPDKNISIDYSIQNLGLYEKY